MTTTRDKRRAYPRTATVSRRAARRSHACNGSGARLTLAIGDTHACQQRIEAGPLCRTLLLPRPVFHIHVHTFQRLHAEGLQAKGLRPHVLFVAMKVLRERLKKHGYWTRAITLIGLKPHRG